MLDYRTLIDVGYIYRFLRILYTAGLLIRSQEANQNLQDISVA